MILFTVGMNGDIIDLLCSWDH